MRFYCRCLIVLIVIWLLPFPVSSVLAEAPNPSTPQSPPVIPEWTFPDFSSAQDLEPDLQFGSIDLDALPPLKAVLVVGPIDGDYGSWTQEEKASMDLAATELQANGVTVHKFYTPNNNWEQIKSAAQGAYFLLYRGHGVYWGDENFPADVGGFALKDGIISPDVLRSELHLAPNAIVMLYGCFTAGTSSSDALRLTSAEAQRRVALYAQPFMQNGAAGYYANWFGTAFQMFIRYLFQGQTLGQAYEAYFDFSAATVERFSYPADMNLSFWLDKDEWYEPKPQYNNAFVGLSSATLVDLFASASIELTPNSINYLAEPLSTPRTFDVLINTSIRDLVWTTSVSPSVSWIAAPSQGTATDPIRVTLTPPQSLGQYQTTITIQTTSSSTTPIELLIPVSLLVTETVNIMYLPSVNLGR
ncbi:MAG: hypothetical protein R6V73_03750 [Anaerolineales bacterium]